MRSVKWHHFQRPSMTAKPDFKGHSNIWCETERQLQWTITINRYLHVRAQLKGVIWNYVRVRIGGDGAGCPLPKNLTPALIVPVLLYLQFEL